MSYSRKRAQKRGNRTQRCKSCGQPFHLNGGWKLRSLKHNSRSRSKSRSRFNYGTA